MGPINFDFHLPTRIVFGNGAIDQLADEVQRLKGRRILVVSDPGIERAGLTARVTSILEKGVAKVEVFSAVSANPRDAECLCGVEIAKSMDANALVGLGGGSPMDAAKAIGVLLANGGKPQDWADGRRPILKPPIPLICIPTTAGTGSEVTPVAVITDSARKVKMGLLGALVAPATALVDPELTLGLPPDITAATGMDALTHAIEAFTCRRSTPISDALALAAIENIGANLQRAVRNGLDGSAREQMLLGSLLAGVAFGQADVGAVHSLAESLGGVYDTPHGIANAVFLPHVMAYNREADLYRHACIGRILQPATKRVSDEEAAWLGVEVVAQLAETIGIPPLSNVVSLSENDIDQLAALADAHPCTPSNPREIGRSEYRDLIRHVYEHPLPLST